MSALRARVGIAVIDREPLFRVGVIDALKQCGTVVAAGDDASCLSAVSGRNPNVVVADQDSARPAIHELARLKRRGSTGVIVVVGRPQALGELLGLVGLHDGSVVGLITRSADREELRQAVRMALGGQLHISPSLQGRRLERLAATADALLRGLDAEVLRALITGATKQRIAGELGVSAGTVKYRVDKIYRRLGARNRVDLLNFLASRDPTPGPSESRFSGGGAPGGARGSLWAGLTACAEPVRRRVLVAPSTPDAATPPRTTAKR